MSISAATVQVPAPSLSGVRGIVFDLDNTLVDFLRMKRVASDAAARAMVQAGAVFGFSADEAGDILFGAYMEDLEGESVFARFVDQHHRARLGLSQHHADRITAAAVHAYLRAKMLWTEPYPGVRRTLLELGRRGLRFGVLTDAPRFKAYQRLEAAGIADLFDFVVTATDTGAHKPDPRPFRAALDRMGLPPPAVLMVGDSPERDIAGARAAGMRTAFARYGRPEAPAVAADVVLESFEDLLRHAAPA